MARPESKMRTRTQTKQYMRIPLWPDFWLCVTVAPAVVRASSQQVFPAIHDERHIKAADRQTPPQTRVVMQC